MTTDMKELNQRLIALAESPKGRFWRSEYDALSVPERIFRAVWELEAQVNNGGFEQYFWNDSGSLAPDVVNALHAIGAAQMASIVKRAVDAVGSDISWPDTAARQTGLGELSPNGIEKLSELDQEFYAYPDNLTALLYRYVSMHRDEIGDPEF